MTSIFKRGQLEAMQYLIALALLMRGTILEGNEDYKYCVDMAFKFGDLIIANPCLPKNYVLSVHEEVEYVACVHKKITRTMY